MENIGNISVIALFGSIVILVLFYLAFIKIYAFFKNKEQNYPNEDEIESIILPIAYKGIMLAYKTSEFLLYECGDKLVGVDKKRIADSVYHIMPEFIYYKGIFIPIKKYVSKEQFSIMVQSAFDDITAIFIKNRDLFISESNEWFENNKP